MSSADGGEQTVLGIYERGEQDFYRFGFVDGGEIDVDADHLWLVRQTLRPSKLRRKARARGESIDSLSQTRLMRTSDIVEWFRRKESESATPYAKQQNLLIPLCGPVRFAPGLRSGSRPLEPYLLGVLIGDGCVSRETPSVTSTDPEIMAHIVEMGYEISGYIYPGRPPMYSFVGSTYKMLKESLREMGLLGKHSWEKSVPEAYLYGSIEERWELLRGLMDTDGYADRGGHIEFTSVSEQLSRDVQWLVRSLGGKATLTSKRASYKKNGEHFECRTAYRVHVSHPTPWMFFRIERKKKRCEGYRYNGGHGSLWRRITSVKPAERGPSVCIAVSNPDGLFITNDFIVTHNTDGLIADWIGHKTRHGGHAKGIFLRRTYPELTEVWSRMSELYPATGAEPNKSEMTWTWPDGARIELRYLENDDDAARYMGRSFSAMYIDELSNFASISPVDKLYATLRSAHGIPCIRRSSGNPGGPLTQTIKERYIDPSPPYVPFRWAPNPNYPGLTIESVFIPSTLDNNQILLQNDPGYEARLAGIGDSELYKAWRYGDWNVLSGRYFSTFKPEPPLVTSQVTLSPWLPRWMAIDWGFAHNSSVHWGCYDGSTLYVYREFVANEMTPVELAQKIVELTGKHERIERVFLSPDAFARKSSVRTIADEIRQELPWPVVPADNDRIGGWSLIQQMFKLKTLRIFDNCGRLAKWLGLAQRDSKRPEDVLKTEGDDVGDSLRYLVKSTQIEPVIPPDIVMEQKLRPFLEREDYMGAFVQRMRLKDEQERNSKPLKLKGRRR